MDIWSKNCAFDAEDRKTYHGWLRGTLLAYGALALCGIAMMAVQAMTGAPNVAAFMTTAVALASP